MQTPLNRVFVSKVHLACVSVAFMLRFVHFFFICRIVYCLLLQHHFNLFIFNDSMEKSKRKKELHFANMSTERENKKTIMTEYFRIWVWVAILLYICIVQYLYTMFCANVIIFILFGISCRCCLAKSRIHIDIKNVGKR